VAVHGIPLVAAEKADVAEKASGSGAAEPVLHINRGDGRNFPTCILEPPIRGNMQATMAP
jgi:hypothetical protein